MSSCFAWGKRVICIEFRVCKTRSDNTSRLAKVYFPHDKSAALKSGLRSHDTIYTRSYVCAREEACKCLEGLGESCKKTLL